MSRTPVRGWPVAAWQSIVPPRVINLLQVAVYGAVLVSAALILASPGSTPGEVVLGCVAMVVGPALGIPSAWRGWWGLECSAALVSAIGLAVVAATDVVRAISTDHWVGYPLFLTVALLLAMTQRVLRVWGRTWEPGRGPMTTAREAAIRVDTIRAVEEQVRQDVARRV